MKTRQVIFNEISRVTNSDIRIVANNYDFGYENNNLRFENKCFSIEQELLISISFTLRELSEKQVQS